jgi:hypothetical protein
VFQTVKNSLKEYIDWDGVESIARGWTDVLRSRGLQNLATTLWNAVVAMMGWFMAIVKMLARAVGRIVEHIFTSPDASYMILGAISYLKDAAVCNNYYDILKDAAAITATNALSEAASSVWFGQAALTFARTSYEAYSLSKLNVTFGMFDNLIFPLNCVVTVVKPFLTYARDMIGSLIEVKMSTVLMLVSAVTTILSHGTPEQRKKLETRFYCFKFLARLLSQCDADGGE